MAKKKTPGAASAAPVATPAAPAPTPAPAFPKVGAMIDATPEALAEVDPAATYEVKMARTVRHGAAWLRPSSVRVRVPGSTLIALGDAVRQFARVG